MKWLESLNFFAELNVSKIKLHEINLLLTEQKFSIGSKIYSIGQPSNTFYLVRHGRLVIETIIEVDDYYRIPKTTKEWHLQKTTKRIVYKLKELK